MGEEKSQPIEKKRAFFELVTTLIFSLALGVPIVIGVIVAINGYFRAWEKGEWISIALLVIAVLLLCILEIPSWLAKRQAKKQELDITDQ
jgi:hypothetical protein